MNDLIFGDLILEDPTSADYPKSVYAVLDAKKIQVQRHPHSSVSQEQAQDGTAVENLSGDRKTMPKWRGMATPMVRGMARTTGSAASGVNAMGQSANIGDRRPSGSRRSSQRAAVYRRILDVLDCSVDGRERDRQGQR